jgi:hypothetical protein
MKTGALFIGLFLLFCFVSPAPSQVTAFPPSIPFETVDQGEISYYRYGDPNFTGVDLAIKDKWTWEWFWEEHTVGIDPPPPLPQVNFGEEMIVVTILGYQTTGGGPSIQALEVNVGFKSLHVLIEDNETPGPLNVVTNPFHIIKLRRQNEHSVIFEHQSHKVTSF